MKKSFSLLSLTLTLMILGISCNNHYKVVSPIEQLNLDSLKTFVDKAPKTNDPKDQYYAAQYYLQQYTASDSTKAIDLLTKSVAQNFPFAANLLGNIYSADSTNKYYDIKKAVEHYQIGAKNGSNRAMTNLANLYMDGKGVEIDYRKALQLCTDATLGLLDLAENGDAAAQCELGIKLYDGIGIPTNEKAGFGWIKKSVEQEYLPAYYMMGAYYLSGLGVVDKDDKEAFRYFLKAADKGHVGAMNMVATCYGNGRGTDNDLEKAFEYYLKAANLGNEDAIFATALSYQQGHGTDTNYKEAFNWYKKSAERGNTNAMNNIGAMYQEGNGVGKDKEEAFKWFMKAAKKDNPFSQRVVGDCYRDGDGVEVDKTKAFEWYKKGAENGDKIAMNRLGGCYLEGIGVPKDVDLAIYWVQQSK